MSSVHRLQLLLAQPSVTKAVALTSPVASWRQMYELNTLVGAEVKLQGLGRGLLLAYL